MISSGNHILYLKHSHVHWMLIDGSRKSNFGNRLKLKLYWKQPKYRYQFCVWWILWMYSFGKVSMGSFINSRWNSSMRIVKTLSWSILCVEFDCLMFDTNNNNNNKSAKIISKSENVNWNDDERHRRKAIIIWTIHLTFIFSFDFYLVISRCLVDC